MKVLVTGTGGFLGAHVLKYLSHLGFSIRVGLRSRVKGVENVDQEHVECYYGSILDLETCHTWMNGIDTVIHLAMANEVQCREDPMGAFPITVNGTLNLLSAASQAGVKKFILVSTIHSYGRLSGQIDERSLPSPTSTYGASHHAAEIAVGCEAFNIEHKVILRLSHVVGRPLPQTPHRWTLLPNQLCVQAIQQKQMILKTDGRPLLSFLPVTDAMRGIAHALHVPSKKHPITMNLGMENPISILEFSETIAQRVEKKVGYLPPITVQPHSGLDYPVYRYINQAMRESGFELSGSIEHEIDGIIHAALERSKENIG